MVGKPKIAVYWTGGCGGCDVSFLELGAPLLDVLAKVEIAFWPALVDAKRADVEAFAPRSLAATLINGTLRTEENVEMVHLLREKSQLVVAFGACAHLGGVPGLANLVSREETLRRVYGDGFAIAPPPGGEAEDAPPKLLPQAQPLSAEVTVDYVVPGCPPPPALIGLLFDALLSGEPPRRATCSPTTRPFVRSAPAPGRTGCLPRSSAPTSSSRIRRPASSTRG